MSGDDDVFSDASDKNENEHQYLKCCPSRSYKLRVCVKCFAILHIGYVKKNPYIWSLGGNKITCCDITSQFDDIVRQLVDMKTKNLQIQVRYILKLNETADDRYNILKQNNGLILEKIGILELKNRNYTKK